VTDGQLVNIGQTSDIIVPLNGKVVMKSTGFKRAPIDDLFYLRTDYKFKEDVNEGSGLWDHLFNCFNSGPICGGIALGTLDKVIDKSTNFGIGQPLSTSSHLNEEDNIGGATMADYTLNYHIEKID
jgi:hypothetical protein